MSSEVRPETERTVLMGRLCGNCGESIDDRRPQARYCSDRCRTAAHRVERERRLMTLLRGLTLTTGDLRAELTPTAPAPLAGSRDTDHD